ncbi:MAG: CARDB domain-containing protein [Candidatus Bathyarchaeia archaeon]
MRGPDNSSFSYAAITNASGIASINFTIPHKCPPYENETFGEWSSMASVRIGNNTFQDTLTFRVDWIVKLVSVRTIDNNLAYRSTFGITGDVGLEIALQNVAMIYKNVTLGIVVQDELDVPVSALEIIDFEIPPNERTVFVYCKLNIPKWAHVGKAEVFVSAFTAPPGQGGTPYCPEMSSDFFITIFEPLKLEFHDVGIVNVVPSATSVTVGELVYIDVKVRNEGTEFEKFDVNVQVNGQIIGTSYVLNLAPYSSKTLTFTFNTSSLDAGKYTISANISELQNEADVTDNIFIDGVIEIKRPTKRFLITFASEGLHADADGAVLVVNGSQKTVNDLPCIYWVEEESIVTYSYETFVSSTISGKRFRLVNTAGPPSPLIVTSNMTIIGVYKTQYYLSVSSPYGSPTPTSGWFDAGTTITAFVTSPWHGLLGTRYVCIGWVGSGSVPSSGTSSILTFTINQPSMITWNWKTQHHLSVKTSPAGIASISGEGWYDEGTTVSLTAPDIVLVSTSVRYKFGYWDVDGIPWTGNSITLIMNTSHTATAHYVLQYYLSVRTSPADVAVVPGEGWYDAYVNVYLSAPPVRGYDFGYWDVDGVSKPVGMYQIVVYMDGPHTVTAHYSARGVEWLYLVLLVILILLIILLCVLAYRRIKRKKKAGEEAFYRGWTAWYYGYNLREKSRSFKA